MSSGAIIDAVLFAIEATASPISPRRALPRALSLHPVAYVLMSNRVHLPIETGAVGLSKIMQGGFGSGLTIYTTWFGSLMFTGDL
jgi:hypothetical protein